MMDELLVKVAPLGAWLTTYLIHSVILCAIAYLVARRLAGRPEVGDRAWKLALVGGLFTASLQMATGVAPLRGALAARVSDPAPQSADLMMAARSIKTETGPTTEPASQPAAMGLARLGETDAARRLAAASMPEEPQPAFSSISGGEIEPVADSAAPEAAASAAPVAVELAPAAHAPAWLGALVGVWLAGALFFGGMLLWAWFRLRLHLRHRRPVHGRAAELLDRVAWRAGLRKPIRLSVTDDLDVPIAFGVLHPEISIPTRAAANLGDEQLETLLAHECAHLVRRDPGWRLLASTVKSLLWIQPLNRVACRQLESCSELCADDWAVEHTNRPLDLARCLTEVASWLAPRPVSTSVPAMARPGSVLGQRVRRLVTQSDGRRPPPSRWLGAGAVLVVGGVAFAAPGASGRRAPEAPVLATPAVPLGGPMLAAAPMSPSPAVFTGAGAAAPGDGTIDVESLGQVLGGAAGRVPLEVIVEHLASGDIDEDVARRLGQSALGAWFKDDPDIDVDFDVDVDFDGIFDGDDDDGDADEGDDGDADQNGDDDDDDDDDDDGFDGLDLFSPAGAMGHGHSHGREHGIGHGNCDVDFDFDFDDDGALDLDFRLGVDGADVHGRARADGPAADALRGREKMIRRQLERARDQLRGLCQRRGGHIRERMQRRAERIRERMQRRADRMRERAERMRERAQERAERARERAEKWAEKARKQAEKWAEWQRERAERQAEQAERQAEQSRESDRQREQALRQAMRAHKQAMREAERARGEVERAMRDAERALREAERIKQSLHRGGHHWAPQAPEPPTPPEPPEAPEASVAPVAPVNPFASTPPTPAVAPVPAINPFAPGRRARRAPRAKRSSGELKIVASPYARVVIDGVHRGTTPLIVELPSGRHRVTLVNRDQGIHQSMNVVVEAGKTRKIKQSF